MAKKYDKIYQEIKEKIENTQFQYQDLLPSENMFAEQYACSRNTVRRALSQLALEGYVQSIHGKGVRVIYKPQTPSRYSLGHVETFKEVSRAYPGRAKTAVLRLDEIVADKKLRQTTTFDLGTPLYYVQRVRYMDQKPLIIDHNYFRRDMVPGLTREICQDSVYEYIENTLAMKIVTTKRVITVEKAKNLDETHFGLKGLNCVAVVSNYTYNADGIMFEYTQSRHKPDSFVFYDYAVRNKTIV